MAGRSPPVPPLGNLDELTHRISKRSITPTASVGGSVGTNGRSRRRRNVSQRGHSRRTPSHRSKGSLHGTRRSSRHASHHRGSSRHKSGAVSGATAGAEARALARVATAEASARHGGAASRGLARSMSQPGSPRGFGGGAGGEALARPHTAAGSGVGGSRGTSTVPSSVGSAHWLAEAVGNDWAKATTEGVKGVAQAEARWAHLPESERARRHEKAARLARDMRKKGRVRAGQGEMKLLKPAEHIPGYTGHKPGKLGFGQEIYLESTPEIDHLLARLSNGLSRAVFPNPIDTAPLMAPKAKVDLEDAIKERAWQKGQRLHIYNHQLSEFTNFLDICIRQGINPTATGHDSIGGFKRTK